MGRETTRSSPTEPMIHRASGLRRHPRPNWMAAQAQNGCTGPNRSILPLPHRASGGCPFKTIADFRKDNGPAIRATCRRFVLLCRKRDPFSEALVAVDGGKFEAVNNRDKNFTPHKPQKCIEQIEASVARYLAAMEAADRHEDEVLKAKSARLKEKIASPRDQVRRFRELEPAVRAAPDRQISLTDPDARSMATSGRGTGIVGCTCRGSSCPWSAPRPRRRRTGRP